MEWGWEVGLGVANDTDQSSPIFCSAGTRRGILGFKGCSPASSYPPQVSYLVPPPGLSVASYSRVCRTYLCNNLTNMDAILHLKARTPKTLTSSSHSCPTCVGEHSKSCLPNFVSSESCPRDATKCYSSTVKLQAGERTQTFSDVCSMPTASPSLREAGGAWRGAGGRDTEFQGEQGKVPDSGSLRGEQVSWLVRCVWKEGQGTCFLQVSLTALSLPCRVSQYHLPPHGLCA